MAVAAVFGAGSVYRDGHRFAEALAFGVVPQPGRVAADQGGDEGERFGICLIEVEVGLACRRGVPFGVGVGGEDALGDEVGMGAVAGDRRGRVEDVGFFGAVGGQDDWAAR